MGTCAVGCSGEGASNSVTIMGQTISYTMIAIALLVIAVFWLFIRSG